MVFFWFALVFCCSVLVCNTIFAETDRVVVYPGPEEITPSDLYEVTVNGKPVFVYPCKVGTNFDEQGNLLKDPPETTIPQPAAFCYFDFGGKVEVSVTVKSQAGHSPLKSVVVRPTRQNIKLVVKDNTIIFFLKKPCKLSIEPNSSTEAPLFIFANAPEENPPKPDDPRITYYFRPGVHILGFKALPSDSTVYIAGGAVVYGQFWCRKAKNIKIFGHGILDGSKAPRKQNGRADKCVIC